MAIARRFFSQAEAADLVARPEADQPLAFFRCWTRKEAFIKAKGGGLSIPLAEFRVTLGSDEGAALVDVACKGAPASRLASLLSLDRVYAHPERLTTLLDNHDLPEATRRIASYMQAFAGQGVRLTENPDFTTA